MLETFQHQMFGHLSMGIRNRRTSVNEMTYKIYLCFYKYYSVLESTGFRKYWFHSALCRVGTHKNKWL